MIKKKIVQFFRMSSDCFRSTLRNHECMVVLESEEVSLLRLLELTLCEGDGPRDLPVPNRFNV